MHKLLQWINDSATEWLIRDGPPPPSPLCDFKRLRFELRPGDVLLVEGRSRVSEVIKVITQSPWSHAALHIGHLHDIRDPELREAVSSHYEGDPHENLIIEALMGKGTIITPLSQYRHDHLRICRPDSLSPDDADRVIRYGIRHLGLDYDLRQILDLARFFFPWSILPRRWRSSLFQHNAGKPTRSVCSTLITEAFMSVDYPILPFIDRGDDGSIRFFKRNPKLFAPRDFDTSPYFSIIKYPFLGIDELGLYRKLPWSDDNTYYNDEREGMPQATASKEPEIHTTEGPEPEESDQEGLQWPRWLGRLGGGRA